MAASHTRQERQKDILDTILILSHVLGNHESTIRSESQPSSEPRMSSSALYGGMCFSYNCV